MTDGGQDALRELRQRLDRASDAAERLISEAAERVAPTPPPAGWQRREPAPEASGARGEDEAFAQRRDPSELESLLALLHTVRGVIPPELQHRLGEALREVLLAVRALIDWYLERSESRRPEPADVEDIPIS